MLRASYRLLKACSPHPRCLARMAHFLPSSGPSSCSQRLYSLGGTGYIDVHKDDLAHTADYDVLITDIDEEPKSRRNSEFLTYRPRKRVTSNQSDNRVATFMGFTEE